MWWTALLAPQLWPLYALAAVATLPAGRPGMTAASRIARGMAAARNCRLRYQMGAGGKKTDIDRACPSSTGACDCSGFVAWILGIARGPRRDAPVWIETTNIWRDATGRKESFVPLATAKPGCLLVYPDQGTRQGHVALLTTIKGGRWYGVDCSAGRAARTGQALGYGPLDYFRSKPDFVAVWPRKTLWEPTR